MQKDALTKLLLEAKSYGPYEDIEKLVELEADLSMVPIQPLYASLLSTSSDKVALIVSKLSSEQRQSFIDLDLWEKDHVSIAPFEFWIEVYSKVQDLNIVQEFVSSEDFLLYLKSRINVYTFDTEDPEYPDHDYYFLTDDMLLLIEYSEEYNYPQELKYLIRNLYDKLGVENAYSLLFKLINDSFSVLQENIYQAKKERLRDLGFVDYYEALEKTHGFISYKQIDNFILNKKSLTPSLDVFSQNQSLHRSALTSFDETMESLFAELIKVSDEKRLQFLQFTFLRLINSTITLNNAFRSGSVELSRIGKVTRSYLELGLEKIQAIKDFEADSCLFNHYDFFDLYRVGKGLIELEKKRIKKALVKTPFEKNDFEYFLGAWWGSFLENSDLEIPKVKTYGAALQTKEAKTLSVFSFWKDEVTLFVQSIPFIKSFFDMLEALKKEGKLHDEFYLNYNVENIDFESILISSFINFRLGHFSGNDVNKMGVTIFELKEFFRMDFHKINGEYLLKPLENSELKKASEEFIKTFGFEVIYNFESYLYGVLSEHLSGYDFDTLEDEDFKHIGGPILLNSLSNN